MQASHAVEPTQKSPVPNINLIELPEHLVTIDSESTRDIDDAIGVEQLESGFRVVIAITDPISLVKLGSTEDENAKLLGATVYVRDSAVRKMLPPSISEIRGSLIEGKPRKVFAFEAILDAGLDVVSFRVSRQMATVSHRLSYDAIPLILQGEQSALQASMKAAASLGHQLLTKRRKNGAMALYDLARMLYMDDEGRLVQLARKDDVIGHIIVQELMILVNSLAAGYMVKNEIPGIFRNHKAKSAAPSASELSETIQTWIDSGTMDASVMASTFSVLLGKAQYGATVTGHYALALPFYVHLSSPLRRYADLVNLRQMRAYLKKIPFPYEQQELQELAEFLNEKADDRKEERSNGFKEVVKAHAARALHRGSLDRLADHEMVQAIKIGRSLESFPDALVDELVKRLNEATATDKIVDCLFQNAQDGLPDALKSALANWVVEAPTRAVNLLMHASQSNVIEALQINAQGQGTSFLGTVIFAKPQSEPVLFSANGSSKREAEQSACAKAALSLFGASISDHKVTASVEPLTGNPKSQLMELCQAKRWPMPVYASTGKGPSHAMIFQSTVSVTVGNQTHTESFSGAANKKDAEAQASALLFVKLGALAAGKSQKNSIPDIVPSGGQNPISLLQELAQKKGHKPPEYTVDVVSEVPPKFRITVSVKLPVAGSYVGEASTKQQAKTNAAARALSAAEKPTL